MYILYYLIIIFIISLFAFPLPLLSSFVCCTLSIFFFEKKVWPRIDPRGCRRAARPRCSNHGDCVAQFYFPFRPRAPQGHVYVGQVLNLRNLNSSSSVRMRMLDLITSFFVNFMISCSCIHVQICMRARMYSRNERVVYT